MQENEIIYVTPKAYRLLSDECARSLLNSSGLVRDEEYVMLLPESEALDDGWEERRMELAEALRETGVSIDILDNVINASEDFVEERVHELLRCVRIFNDNDIQPKERVFISDKAYRRMLDFIANRHFYYIVDDIDSSIESDGFVSSYLELSLKKTESKLRSAFEKSGADFDEFYDMFYEGDLGDDNREFNIRKILRKYYPESMRETLEELDN